jgi:hypothetical protein
MGGLLFNGIMNYLYTLQCNKGIFSCQPEGSKNGIGILGLWKEAHLEIRANMSVL